MLELLDEQTEPASIKRLAYKSHSILPHIRQLVELSYETKQSDAVRLAALLSLVSVEFDCRLNAPNEDWQRVDANQSSWNLTDSVKEIKQILDASKNQATLLSLQPLAHEALLTWAEWTMQRDSTSSNQVMESLYWLKPRVQDRRLSGRIAMDLGYLHLAQGDYQPALDMMKFINDESLSVKTIRLLARRIAGHWMQPMPHLQRSNKFTEPATISKRKCCYCT